MKRRIYFTEIVTSYHSVEVEVETEDQLEELENEIYELLDDAIDCKEDVLLTVRRYNDSAVLVEDASPRVEIEID